MGDGRVPLVAFLDRPSHGSIRHGWHCHGIRQRHDSGRLRIDPRSNSKGHFRWILLWILVVLSNVVSHSDDSLCILASPRNSLAPTRSASLQTPTLYTMTLFDGSLLVLLVTLVTSVRAFQFDPLKDPTIIKPFVVKANVDPVPLDKPLESTMTPLALPPLAGTRHATQHKPWGVDKDHANEYWLDQRIHTLGNVGWRGALHAAMAPLSTKIIDVAAYQGMDIRKEVSALYCALQCCIRVTMWMYLLLTPTWYQNYSIRSLMNCASESSRRMLAFWTCAVGRARRQDPCNEPFRRRRQSLESTRRPK